MSEHRESGDLGGLPRRLRALGDDRLTQVVAVVDALPQRGNADALIAPLRGRLAQLRPPRPITLPRLLFEPVAPLIMPTAAWHVGSPGIPRAALSVLGKDVAAALGEAARRVQLRMAGRSMTEPASVASCGADLWPLAATLLPGRPVPACWQDATGLPVAAHAAIVVPLSGLLAEAPALYPLALHPEFGSEAEAGRLLRHAAARGADTLAMMLALLLRRLPNLRTLLQLADGIAAEGYSVTARQGSDRVMAAMLAEVRSAAPPRETLPEAADRLRRGAAMLEGLRAAVEAAPRPGRLQLVRAARHHLEAECRERLAADAKALATQAKGVPDQTSLMAMEDTARALRRLDAVGRYLGDAEPYDRALSVTAGRLAAGRALPRVARLRLAEILLGPDAALALVGPG